MLYQQAHRRPAARFLRRAVAFLLGIAGYLACQRSDAAYLNGMDAHRLEDLGLRRTENGSYRFFD